MTDVKSENIIQHLSAKWKGRACPMCGTGNWTVSDKVFELREYHDGNIVLGSGPIVPLIPVTCDNCGNVVFVNAIVAGSVASKKKEETK
jgi:ribosomal protein S27AE